MSSSLILASMKNNIIDPDEMFELGKRFKGDYRISTGDSQKNAAARDILNQSVSLTSKKRACCLGQKAIDIRIPLPIGIDPDQSAIGQLAAKYGFYDKLIEDIPIDKAGYCTIDGKDYTSNSANCDDFYNLYCKNIVAEYTAGNDGKFDTIAFSTHYKPECACFIPTPEWLENALGSEPVPKCMFPGCGTNQNVYLDAASRSTPSCDYTICSQNLQIDSATLAKDASFAANFQNTCGKEAGTDPLKQAPVTNTTVTGTADKPVPGPIVVSGSGSGGDVPKPPVAPPGTTTTTKTTIPTVPTVPTDTGKTTTGGITDTLGTGTTTTTGTASTTEEQNQNLPLILGGGGFFSSSSLCICLIVIAVIIFAMTRK